MRVPSSGWFESSAATPCQSRIKTVPAEAVAGSNFIGCPPITVRQFRVFHSVILLSHIGWRRMFALLRPRSERSKAMRRRTGANTVTGFEGGPFPRDRLPRLMRCGGSEPRDLGNLWSCIRCSYSPRGSETMLLDQPEAGPFERRSDVNRSRRSWFVATAAAPTLLRVSSGGAIGAAGSVSPNGTGQRRGPRKPGSRSSAHRTTKGSGSKRARSLFLFHVSDASPIQEHQKSPESSN